VALVFMEGEPLEPVGEVVAQPFFGADCAALPTSPVDDLDAGSGHGSASAVCHADGGHGHVGGAPPEVEVRHVLCGDGSTEEEIGGLGRKAHPDIAAGRANRNDAIAIRKGECVLLEAIVDQSNGDEASR
jgi:hypothetical protein